MRVKLLCLVPAIAIAATGCDRAAKTPEASQAGAQAQTIAWREGDVDDALAEARESHKPVLLYWGAKWCPPCNQMKSTLFKDPAFVAQTRQFVPVYLDGDSAGAQRWGERFGISGYPTVIVLQADGSEITRLSSGTAASRLADVLRVASARTISAETLLERAQSDPAALSGDDWQLLAAFDWHNDPRHFAEPARATATLDRLAGAAPTPALQRRFALLASVIAAAKGANGSQSLSPERRARLSAILPQILANADEVNANREELSYAVAPLILGLPDAAQRQALGTSLVAGLDRLFADPSLPIPDRLATVEPAIILAKAGGAAVPAAVRDKVRARAAWADGQATDPMARQSVISNAADLLHEAGDDVGAKRMLEAELTRSASPYYYMLDLASLAEDGGDAKGAIGWARKAYETAQGPATRVQWAIEYSKFVLRLAPDDKATVEAAANAVIDELGRNPDGYYQRTRVKITAWGGLFKTWSAAHGGSVLLARLDGRMADVCARQGQAAATCRNWTGTA